MASLDHDELTQRVNFVFVSFSDSGCVNSFNSLSPSDAYMRQ